MPIQEHEYEKLESFLLFNNYYRISGYSLSMRNNDVFTDDASVDKLIQIYETDRRMRHIMLSALEIIEVKIKSLIAYYHSKKHTPLGYLDQNNFRLFTLKNFNSLDEYQKIISNAEKQKNLLIQSEPSIQHHKENKKNIFPFWVFIDLLTMTDVSKLHSILETDLMRKIASDLNFVFTKGFEIVRINLHCIANLRNMCAHGMRLYNKKFIRKPKLSSEDFSVLRTQNGVKIDNRLFSYILIIKSLISQHEYKLVSDHLYELANDNCLVDFRFYGFPDNWKAIL